MRRKSVPQQFNLIGRGVYSLADASRLTAVPVKRIRRWTLGHSYRYKGELHHSPALVGGRPEDGSKNSSALSFLDLLEVRFLDAFREHGVSVWSIRVAVERAREIFGNERPFSSKRFKTDGRTILAEIDRETNDPVLVDLVRDQVEFDRIVSDYLYAGIEFDKNDQPNRWWPLGSERSVLIDPELSFGAPIIARKRIPTRVISRARSGTQSLAEIAEWYDLNEEEVADAIEFEKRLAR